MTIFSSFSDRGFNQSLCLKIFKPKHSTVVDCIALLLYLYHLTYLCQLLNVTSVWYQTVLVKIIIILS